MAGEQPSQFAGHFFPQSNFLGDHVTTAWTPEHVAALAGQDIARLPLLTAAQIARPRPELFYWDMWPVQDRQGRVARIRGRELWMILTAPDDGDPAGRHLAAKIHLLERHGPRWTDLGPVLPDFGGPYQREWSGSAIWHEGQFTLWFTGAGLAAAPDGYQQALFETTAATGADGLPQDWSTPLPILTAPSTDYIPADAHEGAAGQIKAYRDPAYFQDPATGREYLVFSASRPAGDSAYTGSIGLAEKIDGSWVLLPPLVHAGGVNNEMERAHMVYADGRYFVFWVTQTHTFAPALRHAPTGLYGMAADRLLGPYTPLNGTGLVLANPVERPAQAYSWSVTRELLVSSFVESVDDDGGTFAGTPAPLLRLAIDAPSNRVSLVEQRAG